MKSTCLLFVLNCVFLYSVKAQNKQETKTNDAAVEIRAAQQKQENSSYKTGEHESKRKNYFVGVSAKANVFLNHNSLHDAEAWKQPTWGGTAFVGKWFNQYIGTRIVLEGGNIHPYFIIRDYQTDVNYILGRLDAILDVTNFIRSYSPDNFYSLKPYVGIGVAHSFKSGTHLRMESVEVNNTFVLGGGLWNTFRLTKRFSAYLNLGLDLVDSRFDGYKGNVAVNGVASFSIGLIMKFKM